MVSVRPYGPRVTVTKLDMTESESRSGLIVPSWVDESLERGIVEAVGGPIPKGVFDLQAGQVIYYTHGRRINNTIVVDVHDIIAIEED